MDKRYWPFPVLPAEQQNSVHRAVIHFLEVAHREGFRPYSFDVEDFGASTGDRVGLIIFRTRSFWELRVDTERSNTLAAYVGPFAVAADAVLCWLRGNHVSDILESIRPHLVPRGGLSSGYRLNGPDGVVAADN
jgi:hypothetical protein